MLDIRILREQPDFAREKLALVGCAREEVDHVIDVDRRRRELITAVEQMRAERKTSSKSIGAMKPGPDMEAAKAAVRTLGEKLASHFVAAEIRHFPAGQADTAKKWILS